MCGILGYVGKDSISLDEFRVSLDTLTHRGPDDSGVYQSGITILGHRRLSIIDLSKEGHQPFIDNSGDMIIVFNGEIYNYLELKDELVELGCNFRSNSDTEVLLAAYSIWGEMCLQKINGMFAFAILDVPKNEIFIARDRYGVKPFYYVLDKGVFIFASEPKAIIKLAPEYAEPDTDALYKFLRFGDLHNSKHTFYKKIKSLNPAHSGVFDISKTEIQLKRYWDYPVQENDCIDADEAYRDFEIMFENSVMMRMRSDVPVGLTLSGGIDSTSILSSMMKYCDNKKIRCFTSGYDVPDKGEVKWAKIACSIDNKKLELIEVFASKDEWLDALKKIIWHMDGPGFSPAVYPVWKIMKEARSKNIPVLLEGQGADELLGGYVHYNIINFISSIKSLFKVKNRKKIINIYNEWQFLVETFGLKTTILWLFRELFSFLIEVNRSFNSAGSTVKKEVVSEYKKSNTKSTKINTKYPYDPVTERLYIDHSSQLLPSLLHYGDAISMAHSIESRQPFMDYRLVEMFFKMNIRNKFNNKSTKWFLRRYLSKNGQDIISKRTDKVGYLTPVDEWMLEDDCKIPRDYLLGDDSIILKYCDKNKIKSLIKRFKNGKYAVGNHIYRLLTAEIWLRSIGD